MRERLNTTGTADEYIASLGAYIGNGERQSKLSLTASEKLQRMGFILPSSEVWYPTGRQEMLATTSPEGFQEGRDTALMVIAHPDDEAFASATLVKLREKGKQVIVVALTSGNAGVGQKEAHEIVEVRRREAVIAMQRLGVNLYLNLDFGDGLLTHQREEAVAQLTQYMRIFDPQIVIAHRRQDYHDDHIAASQIAESALFAARNENHVIRGIDKTTTIPALYEMDAQGSQTRYGELTTVTHVVRVRGRELAIKQHAFAAHESQVYGLAPDGKSTHMERLLQDTRRRGKEAGMTWGEGLSQVTYGGEKFTTQNILQEWLGKREVITVRRGPIRRPARQVVGTLAGIQRFDRKI